MPPFQADLSSRDHLRQLERQGELPEAEEITNSHLASGGELEEIPKYFAKLSLKGQS